MKLTAKPLISVFKGWMNVVARDIADNMGNRYADSSTIALVLQALATLERTKGLKFFKGLKGPFELAMEGAQSVRTPTVKIVGVPFLSTRQNFPKRDFQYN